MPLFIFDAGLDGTGPTMDLNYGSDPVQCQILVRLRSSRVFFADPPPRPPGKTGRTTASGPAFRCADPATWPLPHTRTLQRPTATVKLTSTQLAADPVVHGSIAGRL